VVVCFLPLLQPRRYGSSSSSDYIPKIEADSPPPATPPESCESSLDSSQTGTKHTSPSVERSAKKARLYNEAAMADDGDDPDVVFGRHVAHELKLVTDMKSKQFAKLQIHSILFNAQFGLTTVPNDVINALTGSATKS